MTDFTTILAMIEKAGIKVHIEAEGDWLAIVIPTQYPKTNPNSVYISFNPDRALSGMWATFFDPDDK